MKFFDFGTFSIIIQMLSHDKIIVHMLITLLPVKHEYTICEPESEVYESFIPSKD